MYLGRCSARLVVELFQVYKTFEGTYNGIQGRMIPPPLYTSWFKGKNENQLNHQMMQEEHARTQRFREQIAPNAKQNASELEMFRALMYDSYTGEGNVKTSYNQPKASFQAYGQSILSPHESQNIVQYQNEIMQAKRREEELHRCQQIQAENRQALPQHCMGLLQEFAQAQAQAQGQSQAHTQTPQSPMMQTGVYPPQSPGSPGMYTNGSPTNAPLSHFAHQQQQASPFYTPPTTELKRIYTSEPSSSFGGAGQYGHPTPPQSYTAMSPSSPSYMSAVGSGHPHDPRALELQRRNSAYSTTYPPYEQPSSPWRPMAQAVQANSQGMPGGFAFNNHIA